MISLLLFNAWSSTNSPSSSFKLTVWIHHQIINSTKYGHVSSSLRLRFTRFLTTLFIILKYPLLSFVNGDRNTKYLCTLLLSCANLQFQLAYENLHSLHFPSLTFNFQARSILHSSRFSFSFLYLALCVSSSFLPLLWRISSQPSSRSTRF